MKIFRCLLEVMSALAMPGSAVVLTWAVMTLCGWPLTLGFTKIIQLITAFIVICVWCKVFKATAIAERWKNLLDRSVELNQRYNALCNEDDPVSQILNKPRFKLRDDKDKGPF